MRSRLSLTLAFGLALALAATGCSTPCQDLGERICNCEGEGQIRNNCKTNVQARVKASSATDSEQDYCEAKLSTCPDPNGNIEAFALPTPGGGDGCTTIDVPALQSLPDAL